MLRNQSLHIMARAFSCHSDVVNHVVNFLLPIDCESVHRVACAWRDAVKMRFSSLNGMCELIEAMSQIYPEELREQERLGVIVRRSCLFHNGIYGPDIGFCDRLDGWLRRNFGKSLAAIIQDKVAMAKLSGPLMQELLAVENNPRFPLLLAVPSVDFARHSEDLRFVWEVLSNSEEVASFMKQHYQRAKQILSSVERPQKLRSFLSLCGQMMQELVRTYTLSMPNLCYESDLSGLTCFLFRPLLWERKAARAKTRLYGKGPVNRCELAMDRRLLEHVSNAAESIFTYHSIVHSFCASLDPGNAELIIRSRDLAEDLRDFVQLRLDGVRQFGISRPAWRV